MLTAPYAVQAEDGFLFTHRTLREVVAGRVFTLSGFDFAELYFVVSADKQHLIGIDAGTTPRSVQAAYAYLRQQYPQLPPLTTVFITHAHWDHVGGHHYYRQVSPGVMFYARDTYHQTLEAVARAPRFRYFFGNAFAPQEVASFRPDKVVSSRQEVNIGGTRFVLLPVAGGETADALFIHVPDLHTLFVGDFIMPYLGAPFVEEGNLDGLLQAIDVVTSVAPQHLLHGHEPLTRLFHTPEILAEMQGHLRWLQTEVQQALRQGSIERAALHRRNFIPPTLLHTPHSQLPYLVMRENVLNRLYDQYTGYWHPEMEGMDTLGAADFGTLIVRYLGTSEAQLTTALQQMLNSGEHELAARLLVWVERYYPDSQPLRAFKQQTFEKLKERYQEINPFKFIIYSEMIGDETPALRHDMAPRPVP